MRFSHRVLPVVALVALTSCAPKAPPPVADSAAPASDSPIAWAFDAPNAWDDRVTLDDRVPGSGTYRSARLFTYAPRDTSIVPQALLGIFVYDSLAWAAMTKQGGPPLGDSLTSVAGQVFIASLPQSNPFRAGSADSRAFDSLLVDLASVRKGFRVPQ